METVRWLAWSLWYLPQPKPRNFDAYMRRIFRCWNPWRKFKPNTWHNEDGCLWHVTLSDEPYYVTRMTLDLDVYVARDEEKIIGFNLPDFMLDLTKQTKRVIDPRTEEDQRE